MPLAHDNIGGLRFECEYPASCVGLVGLTFATVVLEEDHQGACSTRSFDLALGSRQDRADPWDCPGTFDEGALHVDHHYGVRDRGVITLRAYGTREVPDCPSARGTCQHGIHGTAPMNALRPVEHPPELSSTPQRHLHQPPASRLRTGVTNVAASPTGPKHVDDWEGQPEELPQFPVQVGLDVRERLIAVPHRQRCAAAP